MRLARGPNSSSVLASQLQRVKVGLRLGRNVEVLGLCTGYCYTTAAASG